MRSLIGIRPIKKNILVDIFDKGGVEKKLGNGKSIWIPSDEGLIGYKTSHDHKNEGIRPRWARVLAISQYAYDNSLRLGDLILCDTLKWARKTAYQKCAPGTHMYFWRIPVDDILLIDDDEDRDLHRVFYQEEFKLKIDKAREDWGVGRDGNG